MAMLDYLKDPNFVRIIGSLLALIITVTVWRTKRLEWRTKFLEYSAAKKKIDKSDKEVEENINDADESTLARVLRRKTLRVGCIVANPWFIFTDDGSQPTGIYPLLLNDIAKRNNLDIIYTPIRNHAIFDKLDNREVDIVAQLLHTNERAKRADYTAVMHHVAMVAIVEKKQTKINSFRELKTSNVVCAVVKGEIGCELAQSHYDMKEENERLFILNTNDVPAVFYQLRQGSSVDVAITTYARWIEFQKRDPKAAKALKMACDKPLLLIPAGSLIKRGENDFSSWFEKETEISRAKDDIIKKEDKFLENFTPAIEKI